MRNKSIDGAKFLLVALVAIEHILEVSRNTNPVMNAAYRFIYLFHVPAFVYVSGIVSSALITKENGKRLLSGILLPYLVFQGLYTWQATHFSASPWSLLPANPYWLMWYLVSLIAWRLMLPIVMSLRWPIGFAVLVALAAGLSTGINSGYSVSRTLVFFPFFVAGHIYGVPVLRSRLGAFLGLACLAGLAWTFRQINPFWLYGSAPYSLITAAGVGAGNLEGLIVRTCVLAAGGIGAWCILQLVMVDWTWSAWLGRYSMASYLLHGLLIKWAAATSVVAYYTHIPGGWRVLSSVAIGLSLVAVLGALGKILDPVFDYGWLWNRRKFTFQLDSPTR